MSSPTPTDYTGTVAIIGMAGRFPGARNVGDFWRNIVGGVRSIRMFSDEELLAAGVPSELLQQPNYVKAGTVIDDAECFDAKFFGYSAREAEVMDPQHRLFLECCWEALEDGAYDPETFPGAIGVFAGSGFATYLTYNVASHPDIVEAMGELQLAVGNERDSLASTVSYKLNLRGPSVAVQTFCSTSLVAVHLACQSLLTYECHLALAGGVAIPFPQSVGYLYQEGGILSPDGHCRSFDAAGQGSVMGSGLGVVVLKRMEEALADGDRIYAVIKGSAVNNDGSRKVGYTAPGLNGQTSVIALALSRAGVKPETISYVEGHGTGTPLGDSVELAAMIRAFQRGTSKTQFCAIGSVKPNIGHLDRASGVIGLIKTALALTHRQIPPTLEFECPNPEIDLASSPFFVNQTLRPWETNGAPRRAGVSSFGLGGTNAHVVLEEASERTPSSPSRPYQLLLLSAKTENALEQATRNLAAHLRQISAEEGTGDRGQGTGTPTTAEEGTADRGQGTGRPTTASTPLSQPQTLSSKPPTPKPQPLAPSLQPPAPSSQSSVLADIAYTLQVGRSAFNHRGALVCHNAGDAIDALETCDPLRLRTCQQNYRDRPLIFLFPDEHASTVVASPELYHDEPLYREVVDRCCAILQPLIDADLCTTLLAAPPAMTPVPDTPPASTRMAAFVAAYALARLLLSWGVKPQGMLGQGTGEYVAACLAGVLPLEQALVLAAMRTQLLCGTGDVTPERFVAFAHTLTLRAPEIPFIAQRRGTWITNEQATDQAFWAQSGWRPERFAEGLATLWQERSRVLLAVEHGSSLHEQALKVAVARQVEDPFVLSALPATVEPQPALARLLGTLAELWLAGVQITWADFNANQHCQRVALPTYSFECRRYWIERQVLSPASGAPSPEAGKRTNLADWFYRPLWKPAFVPEPAEQLPRPTSWLIFADADGIGMRLAERLIAHSNSIALVRAGTEFTQSDEQEFTIDPTLPENYRQLLQSLRAPLGAILHLWSLDVPTAPVLDAQHFDTAQQLGFFSLIHLTRALGHQIATASPELWVVTRHAEQVASGEAVCPEQATLAGACTVVAQENLDMRCRRIDVDRCMSGSWQEHRLVELLLAELAAPTEDLAVAYRGGERWIKTYEPVRLAEADQRPALRQNGVYLITGGLGNIGLVLAVHLARSTQARLVLTTHSPFPPDEAWDAWLAAHDEADPICQKICSLQDCQAAGSEVLVVRANVAEESDLRAVLAAAQARFGALHGVIYAAGTSDPRSFGTVQQITLNGCTLHFATKVYGLLALERALNGRQLDFCLIFSSLASVLGGLGFIGYTAANSFVDVFVQRHNQISPTRWTAVNWDTWNLKDNPHGVLGATVLNYAMTREEALHAFERVIAYVSDVTLLVNSTGDLEARLNQWVRMADFRARNSDPGTLHPRPNLMTPYEPPSNDTERIIVDIWQLVLGVELGVHDNFLELGGNSLIGTQVVTRLRRAFQTDIPLTILFEAPTVQEMAVAIELILIEAIEQLSNEESLQLSHVQAEGSLNL